MVRRLPWVDAARGAALLAMAAYHLTWDLVAFHWIGDDITASPAFHALGHAIAASFLALSGVSLVLARRARGPLWRDPRHWRRWGQIVAAACAISACSFWLFPEAPIFFGILHCIALAGLLALPLVDAPPAATLGVAALALAGPMLFSSPMFDARAFWWTGLSTFEPASNDYRPLLPWLGFMLLGIAAAHGSARAMAPRPKKASTALGKGYVSSKTRSAILLPFSRLGRHSLKFYLVHQPLLFGALWLLGLLVTPSGDEAAFAGQCVAQCASSGIVAELCEKSCACVETRAKAAGRWSALLGNRLTAAQKASTHDDAVACYAEAAGL